LVFSSSQTGELDLKCDASMREWRPENHFIVHAITFLKKVFYVKTFETFTSIANGYALSLLDKDRESYIQKIDECVEYSQQHVHDISRFENCPLVFTPEAVEHEQTRIDIMAKAGREPSYADSPVRDAFDPETSAKNADHDNNSNNNNHDVDDDL
jgi:hypothetical protein